jgi:hypothetical protein
MPKITVTVTFNKTGSTLSLGVDPEPVDLASVHGNVDIEWDLQTNVTGATFDGGVLIRNAGSKFTDKGKSASKKQSTWETNGNPNGRRYSYAISVCDNDPSNPTTYTLDPTIMN